MSPTAFETATAVRPLGDGAFAAAADPDWDTPRGPNGGVLAAIVLRAMQTALDDPSRPARSITLHYLRPPYPGEFRVEVEVVRSGRTLSTLTARLVQEGRLCVMAIAAFSGPFPEALAFTRPFPDIPPAGELEPYTPLPGAPPIAHRFVMRPAVGAAPFTGADEAVTGGWMRLHDPQPLDAATLAFYADAALPAAFMRASGPVLAPTIDLTIHFRDPVAAAAVAPGEPVLGIFRSDFAADGMVEEDGELWSSDGVLLAHSRQLALLVPLGDV